VQGYAKAQYNLASMYDEGLGVKQNYSQAATWYQKAAEQNFAKAQFNLGSMYFNGEGVAQDNIQGYMWLKLAKAQGLGDKVKTRLSLVKNLGDSEIKKAKHLVKEWLASHKHLLAAK
jgi:TPR repeat protein